MGFADYQNEVYLNGLGGTTPAYPVGWRDLEAAAYEAMTPAARGYVGGAGECWYVQPGRDPGPYGFRGVPGPKSGDAPPRLAWEG